MASMPGFRRTHSFPRSNLNKTAVGQLAPNPPRIEILSAVGLPHNRPSQATGSSLFFRGSATTFRIRQVRHVNVKCIRGDTLRQIPSSSQIDLILRLDIKPIAQPISAWSVEGLAATCQSDLLLPHSLAANVLNLWASLTTRIRLIVSVQRMKPFFPRHAPRKAISWLPIASS
jgi:hypothetical protein